MRVSTARPLVGLAAVMLLAACGSNSEGKSSEGGNAAEGSAASSYPEENIRWIVPYPPGGGTDTTSRIMATCMEKQLDTTIVVENVTGASGARGVQELIRAKPDGYTIGLAITTGMTVTPIVEDVGFTKDSISPIASFTDFGIFIAVSKKSPYQTAEKFFEAVKASPGKISVGVPGTTSPKAIVFQALAQEYGLKFNIIPLEGQAAVNTALLGGQIDAAGVDADLVAVPFVKSGDFVPLVVGNPSPWDFSPDTPTLDKLGYGKASVPKYNFFVAAPPKLPEDIAGKLESATQTCLGDSKVVEALGGEVYTPDPFMGQEGLRKALNEHQEFYEKILDS